PAPSGATSPTSCPTTWCTRRTAPKPRQRKSSASSATADPACSHHHQGRLRAALLLPQPLGGRAPGGEPPSNLSLLNGGRLCYTLLLVPESPLPSSPAAVGRDG